jgi:hypothetical protein
MQEDPKAIHNLLERLNLKPTVALDEDGATAEKYSVTGIPQTVVIDSAGNVARLFIGASPDFGDVLHDALQAVLHPEDATKSSDSPAPNDAAKPAEPGKTDDPPKATGP